MARRKSTTKTVAFYEIVAHTDTGSQPFKNALDWQKFLRSIATIKDYKDRSSVNPQHIFGANYTDPRGIENLLLHQVRDATDWTMIADLSTGTVQAAEELQDRGYVDTTVVRFFDYGNVVGLVRGSIQAPSQSGLTRWLNAMAPISGLPPVDVRAITTPGDTGRVGHRSEISRLEMRVRRVPDDVNLQRNPLGSAARALQEAYGDATVTLMVTASRAADQKQAEDRRRLRRDLMELIDKCGENTQKARATLYFDSLESKTAADIDRELDFLAHKITAKVDIPAVSDSGETIKIPAAVEAISMQEQRLRERLQTAINLGEVAT